MIVGLTGGIGSGKSTVAAIFRELEVPVYDSDTEAKLLMNNSETIRKKIIQLLGTEAYHEAELNRSYIAKKVFSDTNLLQKLNEIVHPEVKKHFKAWNLNQNSKYVIQESALIFENKSATNYDKIILVTAPLDTRIQRVVKRDKSSENSVLKRIENQLPDSEKIDLADFIIENIDLKTTVESIKKIHDKIFESI